MAGISDILDPNRVPRMRKGLRAEASLNRITLNPSSANPGGTLYIEIPKLTDNLVIVPGSVYITFDMSVTGHKNNTLVNNLGRNLVSRYRVLFGGEIIEDLNRFDLFQTYHDLFLSETDRNNRLRQGISSENVRKIRTNVGDKVSSNAAENTIGAVHNTRYEIPLDHTILKDHGVFYPKALPHPLKFEITLAPVSDVIVYSNTETPPDYKLTNMELEYHCISSGKLANQAIASYQNGRVFSYEKILLHKTFPISENTDGVINEHINVPRKSMTGILCIFTAPYAAGARDSESFANPKITSVKIDKDGVPNKLYSKGMIPTDLWQAIIKGVGVNDSIKEADFYTNKFALWIDLRSYPDNHVHGNGLELTSTRDGIRLEINREKRGGMVLTCYMFVVADAAMSIINSNLNEIAY